MNNSHTKNLLAQIFLKNGKAVQGFYDWAPFGDGDFIKLVKNYDRTGADGLIVFDLSNSAQEQSLHGDLVHQAHGKLAVPIIVGGNIKTLEDVRLWIEAGCTKVFLNMSKHQNRELLISASESFGREKIAICVNEFATIAQETELVNRYTSTVLLLGDTLHLYEAVRNLNHECIPFMDTLDLARICALLKEENVIGISGRAISDTKTDLLQLKDQLTRREIPVKQGTSSIHWSEFQLNSDGLIPVVVQDYKSGEVLMVAYMNKEAFQMTVRTGRMTYWSRSRKQLWIKGETSGHYQYLKKLSIDCDNDTLLAQVQQIGAACHTGNRSCFYRDILKKDYTVPNLADSLKKIYQNVSTKKEGLDRHLVLKSTVDVLYYMTGVMEQYGITFENLTEEIDHRESGHHE